MKRKEFSDVKNMNLKKFSPIILGMFEMFEKRIGLILADNSLFCLCSNSFSQV